MVDCSDKNFKQSRFEQFTHANRKYLVFEFAISKISYISLKHKKRDEFRL